MTLPSLVPDSVKESFWEKILDKLADFVKDVGADAASKKIEELKADKASPHDLNEALKRATERFQNEYEDKALARALTVDTRLDNLPSLQTALRELLVSPFSSGMETALVAAFQQVLTREKPAKLQKAAAFLLRLIHKELSGIPKVQELQQLLKQNEMVDLLRAILEAVRQHGVDFEAVRTAYIAYLTEWYANDDPRGIHHTDGKISTLPLKQVFVALDVERTQEAPLFDPALLKDSPRSVRERPTITERIDLPRAIRDHARLVLLGAPGAGKTTITKYLSGKMAESLRDHKPTVHDEDGNDYGPPRLPIRFRIGEFADALAKDPTLNLREFLPRAIGNCPRTPAELQSLLFDALDSGEALVLMDGLDEIAAGDMRSKVAEEIQSFLAGLPRETRVLITSRIAGYREGARLGGNTAEFTLSALSRPQIALFLAKRCLTYEQMLNVYRPDKDRLSAEIVQHQADEEKAAILKAVDDPQNPGVKLLSGIPLLLTILALIHRNGKHLPNRRIELYDLAVKTLLREWRVASGVDEKHTVSEPEAIRLLGPLATHLHETTSTGRIAKEALRRFLCIERAKWYRTEEDHPDNEAAIDDFLRRVEQHTGLLVEFGQDEYGFLHLTFEEYFAARDLLRESMNPRQRIYEKRHMARWTEPIRLAISYKSKEDPEFAATLIDQVILGRGGDFAPSWGDALLHRDVLLAGYCLADCDHPDPPLIDEIGKQLLDMIIQNNLQPISDAATETLIPFVIHDHERIFTVLIDLTKQGNGSAARALGKLGIAREDVIQTLLDLVKQENYSAAESATRALGQLGVAREDVIQTLLTQVEQGNNSAADSAADALGQLGVARENVIQALLNQIKQGNYSAARALGQLGVTREDVIQALLDLVKQENYSAADSAADTLGQLGVVREDVIQALLDLAKQGNGFAIFALGQLGVAREDVIQTFLDLVKQSNSPAADALGQLGVARENVIQALLDQVKQGGSSAARALGQLGVAREDVIQALLDLAKLGNYSAADALGRLGVVREDVLQTLLDLAKQRDILVADSSIGALGQLGVVRKDVLQALLDQVKQGKLLVADSSTVALMKLVEKATNEGIPLPTLNFD